MPVARPALVAGLAALALTAPAANAGTARTDLRAHTIKIVGAKPAGYDGPRAAELRARLSFPAEWSVRASATGLTARVTGTGGCRWTVTATTRLDVTADDATAQTHAAALTPLAGRQQYVIDAGTRGTSAWRVTRVSSGRQVRVAAAAVAAIPASRVAPFGLAAGRRAYQSILVEANPRPQDECHSGTYRDVMGPAIGDALAITRTRVLVGSTV